MKDGSNPKGFDINHRAVVWREMVDDSLTIEPRSHNMVEAISWETFLGELNGSIDQWSVWDGDTCNDASHVVKELDHLEI